MKILYFALFLLAFALIYTLLNLLIRKMTYPLTARYLHCRTILSVFAVLLAATNVYTISDILQFLDSIITSPEASALINFMLPQRAFELEYMLLVHLGLNLIVILLIAITIGLTKLIFIRNQEFISIDDYYGASRLLHLPWFVVRHFYEERDGVIRLNAKGRTFGIWVNGFKWAFVILWTLQLLCTAVSILWGSEQWNDTLLIVLKNWYLLPLAAFTLLQQIQFFFDDELETDSGSAGSMVIEEKQHGSIRLLMDAYRHVFGNSRALLLDELESNVMTRDGLSSNDLGNQQIEDCTQPDVLNVITNQLQKSGLQQSEQYQNALIELVNGRCINICDRCDGRFLPYLCAYLNFHMSQGHTVLVLCRDRKHVAQVKEAINQEMHRLNSLYCVWNICDFDNADNSSPISMFIGSVEEFLTYQLFEKRSDFAEDLFCTILADGVDLFSRDRLFTEQLFGILHSKAKKQQYITFTEVNNDALRTALEQATKQEISPFSDDAARTKDSCVMIWREESYYRLQQNILIGSSISPYMGAALPLALTAIKYDFPRVYVIGSDTHGIHAYDDVLSMSYKEITSFIGKNVNLKSVIRYRMDEVLQNHDLSVIVVYDTDCNFLNAMTFWQKYGGSEAALLHIISPAYALREYFASNYQKKRFNLKNNEFNAMIPSYLGTMTSRMLVLLVQLCEKGMTEKELMEKSKEYGWTYDNVSQLLRGCLKTVLSIDEIHNVYECFHFEEEKQFCEKERSFQVNTRVTLIDSVIRKRLRALSGCAALVSKDNHSQPLPVLARNVYNYYLEQQMIPVDGYLYQVRSICDGNIHADQMLPRNVPQYYQLCDFTFENYLQTGPSMDYGSMNLRVCTAEVTRHIQGYISSNHGNNFSSDSTYLVHGFPEPLQMHLDCANILEISIRRSEFGGKTREATRLLAYLIKDFAKTLFPATHQNLFAVVSDSGDSCIPQVLHAGKDAAVNDLICSMIPTLKNSCSEDSDSIALYVVECSCIEFGMVQMLYSRYKKLIIMLREYLDWYPSSAGAADPADSGTVSPTATYLHFGQSSIPDVFAPQELLAFCRKILPAAEETSAAAPEITVNADNCCTFCGRPTMFPIVLSDGRRMCAHCKDHQLTQKDEIKFLFADTKRLFYEGYHVSLPKNLNIRFQSADAIAREAGHVDGGRILGFYNPSNHQLWLEARGPKIAMQSTLIHELTHAWQCSNSDFSRSLQKVLRKVPLKKRNLARLLIMEGHAVYMEVETMRRMHEDAFVERIHNAYMQRQDEYGFGYRLVRDYIDQQSTLGSHVTPFTAMVQFLQDILDEKVVVEWPDA